MTGAATTRRFTRGARAAGGASFDHGVASGDPTATSVVLWTRVTTTAADVALRWTIARDSAMEEVVRSGEAVAHVDADHTVHVDVDGLDPASTYSFAFELSDGTRSPVGRTRTARAAADDGEIRLGVVSCSSFAAGAFTAYGHLAGADVDLVVHLGDYLYETGRGPRRHEPPDAPVSLDDYRRRHAQQRSDHDLQRLHAAVPMAPVWDDHDVAGNAWRSGAAGHDPDRHGPWEQRRAAAIRAWLEWLPVRRPDPERPERIWRQLPLGGVADLMLLDTRHDGRDEQVSTGDDEGAAALASPDRRLISEEQRAWLAEALTTSTATWRILGNQVVLTPLAFDIPAALARSTSALGLTIEGKVVNPDAWDGYPAERTRVLEAVRAAGPTIVLTGDVHSSWAFEVVDDDGVPVTVEWVTPSVTSQPFSEIVGLPSPSLAPIAVDTIRGQLPQVRWAELTRHGFLVVALRSDEAQCDWWHVDLDVGGAAVAASWAVTPAESRLRETTPLGPRDATAPAPTVPPSTTSTMVGERDPAGGGGAPKGALAAAGAVAAAAAAALVAIRRRGHR